MKHSYISGASMLTLAAAKETGSASANIDARLSTLGVGVGGTNDIDERLDKLEAFAVATDAEFERRASGDGETGDALTQRINGLDDEQATIRARLDEFAVADNTRDNRIETVERSIANVDPDATGARLDKLEGDVRLALERPVFDPSVLSSVGSGGELPYGAASDQFPRGLLVTIIETYFPGEVRRYNADVAATEDRKRRENPEAGAAVNTATVAAT